MLTVNMHEAKTRLSELVARAMAGEPFIIANRGKPVVKVEALETPEARPPQRIGFAEGRLTIPDSDEFWSRTWKEMDREIEQDIEAELDRDGGSRRDTTPQ